MAGIDRTYVKSYSEYCQLLDWARGREFVCLNGMILRPLDSINGVYDHYDESMFDGIHDVAVMNTSHEMDYFLIKYCPLGFVQETMRKVYSPEYYESVKRGESDYDKFVYPERGHYVSVRRGYGSLRYGGWLNVEAWYNGELLGYSDEYDKFLLPNELGKFNTSICFSCRSLRAVVRKVIGWGLPIGTVVLVGGGYEYGGCTLTVRK